MSQSDQLESTAATLPSIFPCPLSPETTWPGDQIKQLLDMHYRKAPINSAEKVFIAKIRNYYNDVNDLYYNPHFISKVKELVPIKDIQQKAIDLAKFCQQSKQKENLTDESDCKASVCSSNEKALDAKDFFVSELMEWYHNCFFKWFDEPKCNNDTCALRGFKLDPMGSAHPTIEDLAYGASRVELYACSVCHSEHRFPRYNNPIKLLSSRTGRCGEWGNCFTGILTALGYDARLVIDWTDHVWTEYYSTSQDRWIHVDTCEKVIDCPMTYEVGWQKKLTYCIAISRYDVQDVTWRYVSDPAPVLARRNQANETWLTTFLLLLNLKIRSVLPPSKQQQLLKRNIRELAELIFIPGCKKNISSTEVRGRQSGSADWRAARSELGATQSIENGYVFNVNKIMQDEANCNFCEIRYNSVTDEYSIGRNSKVKAWNEATFSHRNLFRKTEYDWKMVYLARREGSSSNLPGEVTWKIDLTDVTWRSIDIDMRAALYQSGIVDLTIRSSDSPDSIIHLPVNTLNSINRSDLPSNTKSILITATLSNGAGDLAWQHAQLFRQSIDRDAKNHSFLVRIIT